MEQLTYLLEKTAHPQVQAMFDTHHANIEEKHLGGAITEVAPLLRPFPLSENDRGPPCSGPVTWEVAFSDLYRTNYNGWLTLHGLQRNAPDFGNPISVST